MYFICRPQCWEWKEIAEEPQAFWEVSEQLLNRLVSKLKIIIITLLLNYFNLFFQGNIYTFLFSSIGLYWESSCCVLYGRECCRTTCNKTWWHINIIFGKVSYFMTCLVDFSSKISVPDNWAVSGQNFYKVSYVTWKMNRKIYNDLVRVEGIDLLEFLVDTLPWKPIWNPAKVKLDNFDLTQLTFIY